MFVARARAQDLARLNQQRERLDGDVKVLQEKISEKNPYGDKADLQVRQQANIAKQVAKKREVSLGPCGGTLGFLFATCF